MRNIKLANMDEIWTRYKEGKKVFEVMCIMQGPDRMIKFMADLENETLRAIYKDRKFSSTPNVGEKFKLHKGLKVLCLKISLHDCSMAKKAFKEVIKEIDNYSSLLINQLNKQ